MEITTTIIISHYILNQQKMNPIAEIKVRYSHSVPKEKRIRIKNGTFAYQYFLDYWNKDLIELQEEFHIMILNKSNEILGIANISKGSCSKTVVDVKLVFSIALKCNAKFLILAHNHPSGNLTPSQSDIKMTEELKTAGELLDVSLLDHLIISLNGYYSFSSKGKL